MACRYIFTVENHYRGNHRNMGYEEEAALLKPFEKKAETGQMVGISEIKQPIRRRWNR